MSYSFSVRAATKDKAFELVKAELGRHVENQPEHTKDRDAVLAVARAYINLLADGENKDISITVSANLTPLGTRLAGANVAVSTYLAQREKAS
jgi:hypothetical protein